MQWLQWLDVQGRTLEFLYQKHLPTLSNKARIPSTTCRIIDTMNSFYIRFRHRYALNCWSKFTFITFLWKWNKACYSWGDIGHVLQPPIHGLIDHDLIVSKFSLSILPYLFERIIWCSVNNMLCKSNGGHFNNTVP